MKKAVSAILALILILSLGASAVAEYGILVTRHPTDCNCMAGDTAARIGASSTSTKNRIYLTGYPDRIKHCNNIEDTAIILRQL